MPNQNKLVDIVFVVTLFFLYLIFTFTLCVIGINVYQKNVNDSSQNYNIRTSVLYITEKTRQNFLNQAIRLDSVADSQALVLAQTIEGNVYENWMYVEDGYLCEVLMPQNSTVIADIGQKIMPMSKLELEINENNLLEIAVTDEEGRLYTSSLFIQNSTMKGG